MKIEHPTKLQPRLMRLIQEFIDQLPNKRHGESIEMTVLHEDGCHVLAKREGGDCTCNPQMRLGPPPDNATCIKSETYGMLTKTDEPPSTSTSNGSN